MSTDFSEILSAMSSVPDIVIDPATGATMGSSGQTLGQKYQMQDKVSPAVAEKMRENAILNEAGKKDSRSAVDAYREMTGRPTSTQIREQQDAMLKEQQEAQQAILNAQQTPDKTLTIQEQAQVELLAEANAKLLEEAGDPMMDMYVNSINKKLKWSK